jgi:hypothetical protein
LTTRQLLLLQKEKQNHNSKTTTYKNRVSGKKVPTDKVLEEEHERFVKYIDADYGEKPPVTDYEMRKHIKKSFSRRKDLDFLAENVSDDAYNNLIADIQNQDTYNKAVAEQQRWIKIKRRTKYGTNQRTGIPLNDKYYYKIVKARKDKKGHRVSSYRIYYSSSSGKRIKQGRLAKYIEFLPQENVKMTRIERIQHLRKKPIRKRLTKREKIKKEFIERYK